MILDNVKLINRQSSKAFTLAEVLVTLLIIGVVAAMTIPTLMKTINDIQYKSAYRKAFSDAQNALNMANKEGLLSGDDYSDNLQVYLDNFKVFMDQFKVTKQCINNDNVKCWDSSGEKYYAPSPLPQTNAWAFIDSSGRAWSMPWQGVRRLTVDTNGFQKPNRWGKDRFLLYVYNEDKTSYTDGIPARIVPVADSPYTYAQMCGSTTGNKCYTENDYFGTSWLYK